MIPLVVERFPLPGGFTKTDVRRSEDGPNVRPLAADVIGDVGPRAVGAARHGRHRAADRVRERRQPVPRPRRRRGSRSWRFTPRSARAGGEIAWELLSESLDARACRRRGRPAARVCRRPRAGRDGAAGLPRLDEIAHRRAGPALHARRSRSSPGCCSACIPVAEVRDAAPRRRAQGRRPAVERRARAAPRAQHAGRRRDRARGRPARGLGPDDPHVPGDAPGRSRVREPGRGAHAARVDPVVARRRRRSRPTRMHEQIAERIEQVPGVTSVGLSSSITMDGSTATIRSSSRTSRARAAGSRRSAASSGSAENYFETMGNRSMAGRAICVDRQPTSERRSWW